MALSLIVQKYIKLSCLRIQTSFFFVLSNTVEIQNKNKSHFTTSFGNTGLQMN